MKGYFLEYNNSVPANPMVTPEHIAPVWYFTPFYAILRAVPDKLLGVVAMGASTMIFFALPWLDRNPVKSIRYRGTLYKWILGDLYIQFRVMLGWLGMQATNTSMLTWLARFFTVLYFAFFLLMPFYSKLG